MTQEVERRPSQEELVAQLDPERDYGGKTLEQVVEEIHAGYISISPGQNLPVLYDRRTNRRHKGSGVVGSLEPGNSRQQRALSDFRARALDDLDEAYRELREGMKRDPRYHKIFWETLVGKVPEYRGGELMAETVKALVEAMKQPERRVVDVQ